MLASLLAFIFPALEVSREQMKAIERKGLTLPPVAVRIMSLEFRSIAADLLFIRSSQFYGGKVGEKKEPSIEDWNWLNRNLDLVTELDPWFQDPYYFANGLLTWDAGMYKEANTLLEKAVRHRYWDFVFPFFIGFNKFYFLGDNRSGAEYLLKASERPGAWSYLPNLAARLYHNDRKTENAIAFLVKFWENEKDEKIKKDYAVRIGALKSIAYLERAVERFRLKFGFDPENLDKLLVYGLAKSLPRDPYGGKFYMDKDASIKTTSKLAYATIERQKKEEWERKTREWEKKK